MTPKHTPSVDISYVLEADGSEFVVSVRTTNGSKLTPQDALDAFMEGLEEAFGVELEVPTQAELDDDTNLH
jgi:lipoate-protein ligase A